MTTSGPTVDLLHALQDADGRGVIDCGGGRDKVDLSHRSRPRYRLRHCEAIDYRPERLTYESFFGLRSVDNLLAEGRRDSGKRPLTECCCRPIIAALMGLDEYRRASHETWEAMARGWERDRAFIWDVTRAVGERMVAALDPKPGEIVLELAAGTGETGFAAARMVGADGRLFSTDFSPAMVDGARRRGAELGLENVDYRVLDAERMDLPDASVDGVLCRYGYMLMADPGAALAETRRVLKPGGRLSFAVVGAPDRNPWAAVPGRVLVELGHAPPPEPGAPGIFAMANEARIRELLAGAGFDPLRMDEVEVVWSFADDEELWRFVTELAGGLALVIRGLPEDEQLRVRSEVERASEPLRSNGGYEMPGLTLNVLAR